MAMPKTSNKMHHAIADLLVTRGVFANRRTARQALGAKRVLRDGVPMRWRDTFAASTRSAWTLKVTVDNKPVSLTVPKRVDDGYVDETTDAWWENRSSQRQNGYVPPKFAADGRPLPDNMTKSERRRIMGGL